MTWLVGGASACLEALVARHRPERIVSLLSPGDSFPHFPDRPHLRLEANDIDTPAQDLRLADAAQVRALVAFVVGGPSPGPILLHCAFGVSRSPAAALVAACALRPDADAAELTRRLRAAAPVCTPNRRIVALGDEALHRRGRLLAAVDDMGRGREYGEPETFAFEV